MNKQKESEIWLNKGGKLLLDCIESMNKISGGDILKFYLLLTGFLVAKSEFLVKFAISNIDPNAEESIKQIKIIDDKVFEDLLNRLKNKGEK